MQWLYSLFLFVIIANQVSEHLNWRISTTTNFLFERIMQRMNSVHAKCVPHRFFFRLAIVGSWKYVCRGSMPASMVAWIISKLLISFCFEELNKEVLTVAQDEDSRADSACVATPQGKKFVAVRLQTRLFAAPHKKEDRSHPQVNNTTKTLSGGPAGEAYPPFCEGLQTAWFAAGLQQIFFPPQRALGHIIGFICL
jgi:hypothetical protein